MNERPIEPDVPDGPGAARPPQPPDADRGDGGAPAAPPAPGATRRPTGGATVVLAARGLVAFELAQWPDGDAKELALAVERLATQGRQLAVPVEAMIVELKQLVARHAETRRPEWECRGMREQLVSVLIEAYYRRAERGDR